MRLDPYSSPVDHEGANWEADGTDNSAHQVAPFAGYAGAHSSTAEYASSVARQAAADVTPAPPRFDATDPPVLGANPFVGLTRGQIAAALGRLLQ
jgi:hypothetical protein